MRVKYSFNCLVGLPLSLGVARLSMQQPTAARVTSDCPGSPNRKCSYSEKSTTGKYLLSTYCLNITGKWIKEVRLVVQSKSNLDTISFKSGSVKRKKIVSEFDSFAQKNEIQKHWNVFSVAYLRKPMLVTLYWLTKIRSCRFLSIFFRSRVINLIS